MYGMRDPVSGKYYHKRVSLMFNCPMEKIERLFRLCVPGTCKHEHEKVEGYCSGYGRRTTLSQVYPLSFCKAFSECLGNLIHDTAYVIDDTLQTSFIADILDSCDSGEVDQIVQ